MSKGWDNATLKKLKALTVKGLSTAEIGKRLGISKNAVVGKLNRLGWNPKAGGVAAAMPEPASKAKADTATKTAGRKTAAAAPAKKASSKVAAPKAGTPAKKATTTVKKTAAPKKATAPAKKPAAKGAEKTVASKPATKTSKAVNSKTLAMHQRIIQHSLEMANLKPNQCRWPIGDPDSENFHFCGETVFVGKPYCYEHCKQAYQFTPPKKK